MTEPVENKFESKLDKMIDSLDMGLQETNSMLGNIYEYGEMIEYGDWTFCVTQSFTMEEFYGKFAGENILKKLLLEKDRYVNFFAEKINCELKYCRITQLAHVRASFDYCIDMRFALLPHPSIKQRLVRAIYTFRYRKELLR